MMFDPQRLEVQNTGPVYGIPFFGCKKRKTPSTFKGKAHASGLATAPLAIVVTADESLSDVWIEDASIAAEHIQLAAFDLGLSAVK